MAFVSKQHGRQMTISKKRNAAASTQSFVGDCEQANGSPTNNVRIKIVQ